MTESVKNLYSGKNLQKYQAYTLGNFLQLPQVKNLAPETIRAIEVVGNVLPFKTNNYVVNNLIDWNSAPNDPMFILTFPQKEMLSKEHFNEMDVVLKETTDRKVIRLVADKIRHSLNPHPAGQLQHNVPKLKSGKSLPGLQHKYRDTVLVFPNAGQTCHAYCTFCFRWPQFVGLDELKFAQKDSEDIVTYLKEHPEITDVLFTGGDPMVMKSRVFAQYIDAILEAGLDHIQTIRIGTKSLSYWPYKFTEDEDADDMLRIFERIIKAGLHLSIMAHFNHWIELSTDSVMQAISRLRSTGAQIRTQSPLLRHINDDPDVWAKMWKRQVSLGCIPYYMFLARDTGAQNYFAITLVRAQEIFRNAYCQVSGLARTVRGPSMSSLPGKIQVLGPINVAGKKSLALRFLRGRNPEWEQRPFLAKLNEDAIWLDDLEPLEGNTFFYQDELNDLLAS